MTPANTCEPGPFVCFAMTAGRRRRHGERVVRTRQDRAQPEGSAEPGFGARSDLPDQGAGTLLSGLRVTRRMHPTDRCA